MLAKLSKIISSPLGFFDYWGILIRSKNCFHFVFSICTYDAFLTLVELSHSAILTEITTNNQERAVLNGYSAFLAGLGSFSSFLGQSTWDTSSLFNFRVCISFVSLFSAVIFLWSSTILGKVRPSITNVNEDEVLEGEEEKVRENKPSTNTSTFRQFLYEIKDQKNFWTFVVISSIQSFDCAFEKSSFAMFLRELTEDSLSKPMRGLIISSSFFFPWLITFLLSELGRIQKYGIYKVLLWIFQIRLVICFFGYVHSAKTESAAPFLLLNRIFSELVCRLSPLILSDLVDEDRFLHKRNYLETRSASLIGASHFFSKIFSSLGPMLSYMLLTQVNLPPPLYRLTFAVVPTFCVTVQFCLWRYRYGLKENFLKRVQEYIGSDFHNNNNELV